jgi:hypothetical protein
MQYVIDRVKRSSELVALAHPMWSYSADDLRALTGYQLLEVVNGPFAAEALWDAALSSGHPVWIVANDDTHDVTDSRRTGIAWNMVDAPSNAAADVIAALRAGRTYAVSGAVDRPAQTEAIVTHVDVRDDTLAVSCAGAPASFCFIGQNGRVRKTVDRATMATYTLAADDPYIRTVIHTPNTVMYLNPVIRYDGVRLFVPVATPDHDSTWLRRSAFAFGCAALMPLLWRRTRAIGAAPFSSSSFNA